MRKILLAALLLPPFAASAQGWEYRVIHLQPTFEMSGMTAKPRPGVIEEQPGGYALNVEATGILNQYASEGWELVSVTGLGGGSHAAFLRRTMD